VASRRRGQQSFEFKTWGGKRKGAGRPPKGRRSAEPHKARVRFSCSTPAHVTLRVVAPILTLRRPDAYHAIRRSLYAVVERSDFRIVHISLERDHLHLLAEADDHVSLSQGLKAFESSAAQRLNRAVSLATGARHVGKVFDDRYHSRLITTPTQARNAISYILNNWRRHGHDRGMETMFWDVDYYSSGPSFDGWAELDDSPFLFPTPDYPRLSVCQPRTWLLRTGWRLAGPISMRDTPGPSHGRTCTRNPSLQKPTKIISGR
jgi:REP element-mobilizing transposase RayT